MNKGPEIILINPPSFVEGTLNTQPIPLGLIFINRFLDQQGYPSKIVNLSSCSNWEEVKEIVKQLSYPRLIGISSFTRQRFSTMILASMLKSIYPLTVICLGGPHASFLDKSILNHYSAVDYIIRGEGEITFLELAKYVFHSCSYDTRSNILGLSFLDKNGNFIRTADRQPLSNLSLLPLPLHTTDELSMLTMSDSLMFHFPDLAGKAQRIAPIIMSRGCNGTCSFCCNRSFWGKNRCTSAEYVFKQFEYYYSQGIRYFDIYDDNFTSNKNQVIYLCDKIISSKININWWCSSRVDSVDYEILEKIKKAGCFMISFGVESGSQCILDTINKGVTVGDIESACKLARQVGLAFRITLSIGHLGETDNTISETIHLINKLRPSQIAIFMLKVYPGTPIAHFLEEQKMLSDEYWIDEENEIVPFFTYEHTQAELLRFRNQIINQIEAVIINKYEDELSSVELDLRWEEI